MWCRKVKWRWLGSKEKKEEVKFMSDERRGSGGGGRGVGVLNCHQENKRILFHPTKRIITSRQWIFSNSCFLLNICRSKRFSAKILTQKEDLKFITYCKLIVRVNDFYSKTTKAILHKEKQTFRLTFSFNPNILLFFPNNRTIYMQKNIIYLHNF